MKNRFYVLAVLMGLAVSAPRALGQDAPAAILVQGKLIEPGASPFHLRAAITENTDPDEHVEVEMFWAAPDKWRRTIKSDEFSQTLVVNGEKTFEQDSADYF